jgi:hypothetical protein
MSIYGKSSGPSALRPWPCKSGEALARRWAPVSAVLVVLLQIACGSSSGPDDGGGTTGTLSGTVTVAGQATVLEGATISVGNLQTTSDANGHFELTDLQEGVATVRAQRAGYLPAQATVTIDGETTHDFALAANEIYEFGSAAVYVPAGVGPLQGVIVTLGGPTTAGFVTGGPIAPPGKTALETSIQSLGASLRTTAKARRVALLGWTVTLTDGGASDTQIYDALDSVAILSDHPELADAPFLTFGLSAGGPEASGLVSRNPGRAIGLVARVPTGVKALSDPAELAVPTLVMQAELDQVVNNATTQATFTANRAKGGLWALVVEPGVVHDTASTEANGAAVNWISAVLTLRLPATPGAPLVTLDETTGWLGDQTTLQIASWANFAGPRDSASWLPSQATALSWQNLGTPSGGGGGGTVGVRRHPGQ